MQLDLSNVRRWVRSRGDEVTAYVGPRVLKNVILHDDAHRCTDCGDLFTSYYHDGIAASDGWVCLECYSERGA